MKIIYDNKKSEKEIIANTWFINLDHDFSTLQNILIKWNNLEILNSLCYKYNLLWKIDLIYIDPPFATNKKFTIWNDRVSTISNSIFDKVAYEDNLLWDDFIEFIRERLVFLKNLLSDTWSIYLHIDYKIWHYIKIIMDEIFGISNFKNDISRIKCNPKNFNRKAYWNTKDMILFYSKSKNLKRNNPIIEFKEEDKKKIFKKIDKNWKYYTTIPLHAPWSTINWDTWKERKWVMPPEWRHRRTSPKILDERDNEWLIERSSNWNPRKKIFSDDRIWKKMQDIREHRASHSTSVFLSSALIRRDVGEWVNLLCLLIVRRVLFNK